MKMFKFKLFLLGLILCTSQIIFAAPATTNFQAHISKPDGQSLESSSVNFTFKFKNKDDNCVLFEEQFNNVSMTGSSGNISLKLGSGVEVYPNTSLTFVKMFDNTAGNTMNCKSGGSYAPASLDETRKVTLEFSYAGSNGLQVLGGMEIESVPYAMYASKADTATNATTAVTATQFSGVLLGDVTGTQGATSVEKIRGTAVSATAPIINQILQFNGVQWTPAALPSAPVTSVAGRTGNIILSNTDISGLGTAALLNIGTTAGTVAAGDDARFTDARPATGAAGGDLSGTYPNPAIATVGTKTAAEISTSVTDTQNATSAATVSTLVKRDASGNSSFNIVNTTTTSATNTNTTNIQIQDGNQAAGKVLTSDASGNGTWQAAAAGGFAGAVDISTTPYTILTTDNGKAFYYSNNANGVINLPSLSLVSNGYSVIVSREVAKTLTITPNGADKFPGGVSSLEMQGNNLQSVTIMKLGSTWKLINQTDECIIGQECWTADSTGGMKQLYAGTVNGKQLFTTPSGCTNSATPTCAGGTDTVTKAWAINSGTTAYNVMTGSSNYNVGKAQSASLASTYTDTDAAKFCENMIYGGYSDWYLPARQELNILYQNAPMVGGFVMNSYYWSSTEYNTTTAWAFGFIVGFINNLNKTNGNYVRCVRSF